MDEEADLEKWLDGCPLAMPHVLRTGLRAMVAGLHSSYGVGPPSSHRPG